MTSLKTGVIGLGAMGAPMARNLHKAGLLHGVWNRTRAKAEALVQECPVLLAETPAALAAACDVVITCVSADADLQQVIEAMQDGWHAGLTVIDTSTVGADTARDIHQRLQAQGVAFLDAPVSGGVEGARKGSLSIMVGGDAAVLAHVRPVFDAIAARVTHMGEAGAGQATKAVNQVMAAGINQAVCEALAFGEGLGLDPDKLIEVIGGGAAGNWFLQHRGPSMTRGRFDPGFKVALHHKDLLLCQAMVAGVSAGDKRLPLLEMTLIHYRQLMQAGHGEEDISALYRLKRGLFTK